MANLTFDQLRQNIGLIQSLPCSPYENQLYINMMKNDQPLPDGVVLSPYTDGSGNPRFNKVLSNSVPSEKEELFVLMKIYKDLHFIKVLFQVSLILGIIAGVMFLITLCTV